MLAKKITNYLISINNIEDIEYFKKVGITTFVFALEGFAIGYERYYNEETINKINEKKYVLINRLLNNEDIINIKKILPKLDVDGFIFEDIGLITVFKELNIKGIKILFMNHFNNNSLSINYWLKYVDSVIVGNELTYEEYKNITNNVNKPIVLNVFGYNQIMYSRRLLLSNYYKKYEYPIKKEGYMKDQNSSINFHIREEEKGTIIYSDKVFNGKRLLSLNNVLFYYINSSFISKNSILDFINDKDIDSDDGFLDKKTIYRLKEKKND